MEVLTFLIEVAFYFSGEGGLHGGKDTDGEKEYNPPCCHLFLLASAEICLCLLGLQSLVYVGCYMQDAPSLLHRLSRDLSSQCHVSTALGCKETVLLFLEASVLTCQMVIFYSGVLPFYKALPGRARQGQYCFQIPQTYVVVSIFPFPPIVPQGGTGIGLRDFLTFREHTHPQTINYICFPTDSFFIHVPGNFFF